MNSMNDRRIDVCVLGGGAAGLAAAIKAKETGAKTVVILDRNEELGGILPQCIHTGFGLHYFRENLTGPEYVSRLIRRANDLGVESKLETMVLNLTREGRIQAVNSLDGFFTVQPLVVVLAMGCRERARGALRIPGTRPAGIFTAGTAQRIMDIEGYLPGKRVVILGSGDVGLIMARRFAMEGIKVEAVVEMLPYPGGLQRNVVQCLEDFNIPLLLKHTVTFIHGADRVEGVTVSPIGEDNRFFTAGERVVPCDTLIISAGLIPENELSIAAGVNIDRCTGGPMIDENFETSVRGIFACGNVVQVQDLVDHVTFMGETAGESAALRALNKLSELRRKIILKPGENVRCVVPQIISGEKTVSLSIRVKEPLRDVNVKVGVFSIPKRAVSPPEMISLSLSRDRMNDIAETNPLEVRIERRARS
jgi:thioredoxin reductase